MSSKPSAGGPAKPGQRPAQRPAMRGNLTEGPVLRTLVLFSIPMLLSNILQSLSGTINNIYIGQMIGVDALAAVSVFFPIMIFLISFVIGLASGASILIFPNSHSGTLVARSMFFVAIAWVGECRRWKPVEW